MHIIDFPIEVCCWLVI